MCVDKRWFTHRDWKKVRRREEKSEIVYTHHEVLQLVRGQHPRPAGEEAEDEAVEDAPPDLGVQRGEGVVDDVEGGVPVGHARQPEPRPLPARKVGLLCVCVNG